MPGKKKIWDLRLPAEKVPAFSSATRCEGTGSLISRGAADLLREAALKLGLGEENFSRLRNEWMASLADQIPVTWRNALACHALALERELPFQPSPQGWRERRWVDLVEVRQLAKERPQRQTAWLLAHGLEEAIARAAELSQEWEGGGPHAK